MWTWYGLDFFVTEVVYSRESYRIPMNVQPTKSTNGNRLSRGINRLLPIGHRYRGDIGVYN